MLYIYTHTHARLHARRSVIAHAHIYKQTIRQQNKNDVSLDYPTDGGNFNPNDYTWCVLIISLTPPLPIYIGMNVHALTRSKKLIQQLYQMGISISYDRIMEIEDWIATSACERFAEDGVVSPACIRKRLFTVGALDNPLQQLL